MNRLADSLSPYLLQHQDNPVDWFAWGDEAFATAAETDRPVFLSVGYAACHWCHVMAHESFEDEKVAAYLNERFVSIKVDREERPDVDQIYMNAVQLMTGHGGWPMSVFLDHDRRPFFAGTYWPLVQRAGMPSLMQVLEAINDAWIKRRNELNQHAGQITTALTQLADGTGDTVANVPGQELVQAATDRLLEVLDTTYGGFGSAPKFPHATDLQLLLSRGAASSDQRLIQAAELTLDRMAAGGIRDHIGGGFARYSVDAQWLVPHFEKMLYDNALLASVYIRAYQVTGHGRHAVVAGETLDYMCREMLDAAGGFHCSEDADSEGEEGKFYVWTPDEVVGVLGDERGHRFCQVYEITPRGNFEGKSIPHLQHPITDWAERLSIPEAVLSEQLAGDREQLFSVRDQRIHPGKDDKILVAWNALAIGALAIGGSVLDRPEFIGYAERAAEFIHAQLRRDDGRLLHAYRQGTAHLDAYVDDYAYTIEALVALYQATGRETWIERACVFADQMLAQYEDHQEGGFFYTAADAETLITRNKDWHDGSLVSGNAAAAMSLLLLSRLCLRDDYRAAAERVFRVGHEVMTRQSGACGGLLAALDRYHRDDRQWVLAVPEHNALEAYRPKLLRRFRPDTTYAWALPDASTSGPISALTAGKSVIDGQPTFYRCQHYSCDEPLVGPAVDECLTRR